MASTITIGPLTRVEGHLDIEVTVETVNGVQQVIDAKCSGTNFRGFETILKGRDPRDATHLTQRICGVCPIAHGMASALTLEAAFGMTAPTNGRIMRNLILGSNFVQSHILHFYHLAAPDYINTTGLIDMSPWTPRYITADMVGGSTAVRLVDHYIQALAMRRKAHQMGAVFGAKLPCSPTMVGGGNTTTVTSAAISNFTKLLTEIRRFIDTIMVPDVTLVAGAFPKYGMLGKGYGNLLAYGVFDLDATGSKKLLARGRYTGGTLNPVDVAQIKEYVQYSRYTSASGLNPKTGETTPSFGKTGAYSWIKAPRYADKVHEVGPLARMWVNGDYRKGISVLDRLAARVLEAQKIANAMVTWVSQLAVGGPVTVAKAVPATATGIGLTEAARGALGHWMDVSASKIARYQVIAPTGWNCSPKDDLGQRGALEQALIGTPVADATKPVEILRVVHSFDPCLACSVHMVRPDGRKEADLVVPM